MADRPSTDYSGAFRGRLRQISALGSPRRLSVNRASEVRVGVMSRRGRGARSPRIVEFPNLDGAFIEIVEQARIDAHLAEVFSKRLPVCAAATDWTVVNADHAIAPDIGSRPARYAYLVWWKISDAPCEPATQGAVAVCDPRGLAWQFYPHLAAVTASVDHRGDLLLRVRTVRKGVGSGRCAMRQTRYLLPRGSSGRGSCSGDVQSIERSDRGGAFVVLFRRRGR